VEKFLSIGDENNTLEIHNIESGHTDEYFVFYLPRQKLLMTGDLVWYRPGKPFTGRSKKLCNAIEALGLEIDQVYVTWPLDDRYGTSNTVSREQMQEGCADAD